jgi:dTDP-4-amino-4,6-dideoxygalactose transaminase
MILEQKIYVTRPDMPDLDEYIEILRDIWKNQWLTNNGEKHKQLEKELCEYLGISSISLISNGTLALLIALRAYDLTGGEIITTPFTFAATVHSIDWVGASPVFCDIDPLTYNIDTTKIESLITSRTKAILPVHVYGNPCDVDGIERIASNYGLRVIYDAAHAFGVQYRNRSILQYGDASVLSFHATKVFSTVEGGAIVMPSAKMKDRVDLLKNFGIQDENRVVEVGLNAKMNELQAAFGLCTLQNTYQSYNMRKELDKLYLSRLSHIKGVKIRIRDDDATYNYSYMPIIIDEEEYGMDRNELYEILKTHGILSRKYFYPLLSNSLPYIHLPSANKEKLPSANTISESILCLPMYSTLREDQVNGICDIVEKTKS